MNSICQEEQKPQESPRPKPEPIKSRRFAAGPFPSPKPLKRLKPEQPSEEQAPKFKVAPPPVNEQDAKDRTRLKEIERDLKKQYGLSAADLESGAWQTALPKNADWRARLMGRFRNFINQPRDPKLAELVDDYQGLKVAVEARQVSVAELEAAQAKHERERRPLGVIRPEGRVGYTTSSWESATARTEQPRREKASIPKTTRTHEPVVTSTEEAAPIPLTRRKEVKQTDEQRLLDLAKQTEQIFKEGEYLKNFEDYNKLIAVWEKKKGKISSKLLDLHRTLKKANEEMNESPSHSLSAELDEAIEELEQPAAAPPAKETAEDESIKQLKDIITRNPQLIAEMEQLEKENEYLRDVQEYNELFKTKLKVDRKLQVIKNPEDITDRMVELHKKIKDANKKMKTPGMQNLKTALDEAILTRENLPQTGT